MIGLVDAPVSESTDVYLLGAVLYEIATGRAPHDAPTPSRTFESIAASPPKKWASAPPRLAAVGQRAMQRLPQERHSSVAELRRDILEYLRSRDPRVASALLEEAPAVAEELVARVRHAAAADADVRADLSRLAHDHDPLVGRRARGVIFVVFGLAWTASQFAGDRVGPLTHTRFALGTLVQLPPLLLVWFGAPDLSRNLFNRRILVTVGLTTVAQCMLFVSAYALDVSVSATRVLQIGLWAIISAGLATLLESKLWPMTVGLTAAFVVTVIRPDLRPLAAGFATLGVTLNVAAIWSRRAHPSNAPPSARIPR